MNRKDQFREIKRDFLAMFGDNYHSLKIELDQAILQAIILLRKYFVDNDNIKLDTEHDSEGHFNDTEEHVLLDLINAEKHFLDARAFITILKEKYLEKYKNKVGVYGNISDTCKKYEKLMDAYASMVNQAKSEIASGDITDQTSNHIRTVLRGLDIEADNIKSFFLKL